MTIEGDVMTVEWVGDDGDPDAYANVSLGSLGRCSKLVPTVDMFHSRWVFLHQGSLTEKEADEVGIQKGGLGSARRHQDVRDGRKW